MTDELGTLLSLLGDDWFLFGLGLSVAALLVGLLSGIPSGWTGAGALLAGTGGATFLVGKFDPVPLAGSIALAFTTALLARPVLAEVSSGSILFVISRAAWRPGLAWPVGLSALLTTSVIWNPRRFARADPRAVAIVVGGAAFAVWASVPDTEIARSLLGATLAVSVACILGERPALSGAAIGAFAGLAAWATMEGGSPRVVSVFGAWCGLALMAVVGLERFTRVPVWAWLVAQLIVVAAGTQIVAVAGSGQAAAGVSFVALAVAGAILTVTGDKATPDRNVAR